MHVLMVDYHVMFSQGLKNLLNMLGAELRIDSASDVPQAAQLAQLSHYDLVLLDWHLADCSGEESIRRLREAGCAARIDRWVHPLAPESSYGWRCSEICASSASVSADGDTRIAAASTSRQRW